jgi:putative lipoic acid-binding regulatory protein
MTDEELDRFKQKLVETMTFPSVYMFKFIITSEHRNIALVENLFGSETVLHTKDSRKGRYTSITAKQVVMSVEEIIDIYRKASAIKGVMFL